MTTRIPPITRRCPFCGAPTSMITIEPRTDNKRYCRCVFCLARGPSNSLQDDQKAIVDAVFDWNLRSYGTSWDSEKACRIEWSKREAFIAKWTKPMTTTSTPTTTTKTNRKSNPNHQPKGA